MALAVEFEEAVKRGEYDTSMELVDMANLVAAAGRI